MTDRRRVNAPGAGTRAPEFVSKPLASHESFRPKPLRTRRDNESRKIFLKTGLTPSASGSAYLELQGPTIDSPSLSLVPLISAPKLTCVVHGPRPLPRSAPFTPHILLSTHIKFAPFASRLRRGYIRDSTERDLSVHLETALRGLIIGERWPKSGVEVIITILEGEESCWSGDEGAGLGKGGSWGLMSLLAACITVASAAIVDAGIDCVDLISGGVAALIKVPSGTARRQSGKAQKAAEAHPSEMHLVLDPSPSEHADIQALCVIGYMQSRDEITEIWMKGAMPSDLASLEDTSASPNTLLDRLINGAVDNAIGVCSVLSEALREAAELKVGHDRQAAPVTEEQLSGGIGMDLS